MKNTTWFSLAAVAAAISTARADLTIVQQVEGAGPTAEITMKIKGDKARIEAGPQFTSIFDNKTGETVTLLNDKKMVMRIPAAQAKEAAGAIAAKGDDAAADAKVKVTPTGKKETIDGYEAEEYLAETPAYKASYWIAKNYPQGDLILKQLQAMAPQAFRTGAMATPDFRDFPGLPIRTNMSMGDLKVVSTLKAVKTDPLPESEFTVPAGFKEMKMPNAGRLPGGKATHPDASAPEGSPKR